MKKEIDTTMEVEKDAVDEELSKQLFSEGGSIDVVDDDGVTHTVSSLDDAVSLVEGSKISTYVKEETPEVEVSNVVPSLSVTPKITDCCETCGEVTCECDS